MAKIEIGHITIYELDSGNRVEIDVELTNFSIDKDEAIKIINHLKEQFEL